MRTIQRVQVALTNRTGLSAQVWRKLEILVRRVDSTTAETGRFLNAVHKGDASLEIVVLKEYHKILIVKTSFKMKNMYYLYYHLLRHAACVG